MTENDKPDWMAEFAVGLVLTIGLTWYVIQANNMMALYFGCLLSALAAARMVTRQ